MALLLLCNRPHEKTVSFQTARFVAATARGLKMGERRLEMGEEIPHGSLSTIALRELYALPMRVIELVDYAVTVPGLAEACARFNVFPEPEPDPEPVVPEANVMCLECGAFVISLDKKDHPKKVCKQNQQKAGLN